jgi:hypothetical protein
MKGRWNERKTADYHPITDKYLPGCGADLPETRATSLKILFNDTCYPKWRTVKCSQFDNSGRLSGLPSFVKTLAPNVYCRNNNIYDGIPKSFRTESITKSTTTINTG